MYPEQKDLYFDAKLSSQGHEATRNLDEIKELLRATQEKSKHERANLLKTLAKNHEKSLTQEKKKFEEKLERQTAESKKHFDALKAKMENQKHNLEVEMNLKLDELKKAIMKMFWNEIFIRKIFHTTVRKI